MPEKIKLEDGTEREVLTEAEVKELQDKATKAEEVEKLQKELEELKADDGNRNWKKMRETVDALKKVAKEAGKEVDDDGNIKDASKNVSPEEIQRMITENTNKALLGQHLTLSLRGLDEEKQKVVLANYNKLTAGEEVDLTNVDKFINDSIKVSGVERPNSPLNSAITGSTSFSRDVAGAEGEGRKNFAETEEGKSLAGQLGIDLGEEEKK